MGRILLLLAVIIGLAGCSTMAPFMNPATPGMAEINGAEVQLFFANPNYEDHLIEDVPLEIFGKKAGFPGVTGGVGLTTTWRF